MKPLLVLILISLSPATLLAQERNAAEPKVQRTVIEDDVFIGRIRAREATATVAEVNP